MSDDILKNNEACTPSRFPERDLINEYETALAELLARGLTRPQAFRQLCDDYRVSRGCLRRYLTMSTQTENLQKKWGSERWQREKQDPAKHQELKDYCRRYRRQYRRLDELIKGAYEGMPQGTALTLREVSDRIFERKQQAVRFRPRTLYDFAEKLRLQGAPLLVQCSSQTAKYALATKESRVP